MKTYKFLAKGAIGPLSGFRWPEPAGPTPGAWIDSEGPLELCAKGAHVCRPFDLAYWIHDELWDVDVDGDRIEGIDCLVARRARLVRRVDAWHEGGAGRFAAACAEHAAELAGAADLARDGARDVARAYAEDAAMAAKGGYVAVSAFAAALAVGKLGDPSGEEMAYRRERTWQADWIARAFLAHDL